MVVKRTPSLTEQVKTLIKGQILQNEFSDGRIPSETELAETMGVSRTTVRDALSRLENEGVVYRKQGSGTFVNEPGLQIKSRLEEIWSYAAVLEAHGYTPSVTVLSVAVEAPAAATAVDLNLSADDKVLVIRKLFREDDEPVIFTENHIPQAILNPDLTPHEFSRPVYEVLAEHGQQPLSYYLSEIVPRTADAALAPTLHIRPGAPLLSFVEIGYDGDNTPILKSFSYFRDDLLRFRLIRRGA